MPRLDIECEGLDKRVPGWVSAQVIMLVSRQITYILFVEFNIQEYYKLVLNLFVGLISSGLKFSHVYLVIMKFQNIVRLIYMITKVTLGAYSLL